MKGGIANGSRMKMEKVTDEEGILSDSDFYSYSDCDWVIDRWGQVLCHTVISSLISLYIE